MNAHREPHPIDAILPTLGEVRTIIEIGCHRMEDTAFLRQTFPNATILAFEPDPRNVALIKERHLASRLGVHFYELAIADRDEVRDFYLSTNFAQTPADEWTRSSSLRPPRRGNLPDADLLRKFIIPYVVADKPVRVASLRIDTFLEDIDFASLVDLIWCDAQSAEDLIIAGATETLNRTRWLFLEHNTDGCYEGAPDRAKLQSLLPDWESVHVWPYDMLMRNRAL